MMVLWKVATGPLRWLWAGLTAIAGIVAYGALQRRARSRDERAESKAKATEARLDHTKTAREIEGDVEAMGDDDLRRSLLDGVRRAERP